MASEPRRQDDELELIGAHGLASATSLSGTAVRAGATVAPGTRVVAAPGSAGPSGRDDGRLRPRRSVSTGRKGGSNRAYRIVYAPLRRRAPARALAGRGERPVPLYCRTCDTTPPRVPLRDRRDARPHPHHLLRHPDVRRPAVPRRAAVDGAHARARPVRARRQADAPLRRLLARRHRRLRAARGLGPGRAEDAVHQAGHRPARRDDRGPGRRGLRSTGPGSTSRYPYDLQPTTANDEPARWVVPEASSS